MAFKIEWDKTGERIYETGIDRGVLYRFKNNAYTNGVAWNGLTSVSESPSGAEPTDIFADNIKYLTLMSAETFGATINAYMAPDEFAECDGSKEIAPGVYAGQQNRELFGLSYRSLVGNDTEGTNLGYKLHLVYGCLASPSEVERSTVNDSPEASEMSWEVATTPVAIPSIVGAKPTSHITIDSRKADAEKLADLEAILYGSDDAEPRLPLPEEVITILGGGVQ